MIQPFLRESAAPSVRRSGSAARRAEAGAGLARAFAACAFSPPLRQNAKRMARSRGHHEQDSIVAMRRKPALSRETLSKRTSSANKHSKFYEAVIPREGPLTAVAAAARTLQDRRHNAITRYYGCHPVNPAHLTRATTAWNKDDHALLTMRALNRNRSFSKGCSMRGARDAFSCRLTALAVLRRAHVLARVAVGPLSRRGRQFAKGLAKGRRS
jgi:hypothetical protein